MDITKTASRGLFYLLGYSLYLEERPTLCYEFSSPHQAAVAELVDAQR